MEKAGFSLIELIVVIAIVSILAAIAVPKYNQYVIRSEVASTYSFAMQKIIPPLIQTYTKTGSFPNSFVENGFTVNSLTGYYSINNPNITQIAYFGGNGGGGGSAGMIQIVLSGTQVQKIPGYDATNVNSILVIAFREVNGVMKYACGDYNPTYAGQSIPTAYRPSTCSCTNVNNFYTTGGSC